MNIGFVNKYLEVAVLADKTIIKYWNNGAISLVHEYQIGIFEIEKNLVNEISLSNWVSGVIYILDLISLQDRVPTDIYLFTERYGHTFQKVLKEKNTYAQFFLENKENGKGVHVIINNINQANKNSLSTKFSLDKEEKDFYQNKNLEENKKDIKLYERYTKAVSQFKI